MDTIPLCPETVQMATDILVGGIGGKFPSFKDCFKKSETVTAKHKLFEQFRDKTRCQIPKVFIYIVMDNIFGPCDGKDGQDLGYHLTLTLE